MTMTMTMAVTVTMDLAGQVILIVRGFAIAHGISVADPGIVPEDRHR